MISFGFRFINYKLSALCLSHFAWLHDFKKKKNLDLLTNLKKRRNCENLGLDLELNQEYVNKVLKTW